MNDLLAYSRVTSRAQPFRKADLGEIAQAVLADMEGRLRGANITVEMSTGMPAVDGDPHNCASSCKICLPTRSSSAEPTLTPRRL